MTAGASQRFEATIMAGRGGGAFVTVPFSVPDLYGTRGQVRVKGTVNGHAFESSLAPTGGGSHVLGLHKATREAIGKSIGDLVAVVIRADHAERTLALPDDLAKALANNKLGGMAFDKLAFTHRKEYVQWVEQAKRPETRRRRIADTVAKVAGQAPARLASSRG